MKGLGSIHFCNIIGCDENVSMSESCEWLDGPYKVHSPLHRGVSGAMGVSGPWLVSLKVGLANWHA